MNVDIVPEVDAVGISFIVVDVSVDEGLCVDEFAVVPVTDAAVSDIVVIIEVVLGAVVEAVLWTAVALLLSRIRLINFDLFY